MRKFKLLKVDLRLFDGAAGAGAAGDGGASAAQAAEGALPKAETNQKPGSSRRAKTGAFDNVVFGKQGDDSAAEPTTSSVAGGNGEGNAKSGIETTSDTLEARRQAYREFVENPENKDIHTEELQRVINRRFKETKGMEKSLADQQPIMDRLAQRYNITDGNASKILAAIEEDTSFWEGVAEEAGLTVEQYKAMKKLEQENAEFQRMRQRQQGEKAAQEKLAAWYAESEKVKELYPSFDFRQEATDRDFLGLLRAGVSVQQAYELRHMEEIKANAAKVAAQTAGQQMAAKIQTKAARPKENGTSSQSAVIVKNDVHSLSKEDRAEQARRAMRGEKIRW